MIVADLPLWALRVFAFAIIFVFVAVPIFAIRIKRNGARRLQSLISESVNHGPPDEPLVSFRFHTYHGMIAFVEQTDHTIPRPVSQAKWLLRKFHRFNLTWGLFALGFPVTPILSFFEYRAQMRSIDEQNKGSA